MLSVAVLQASPARAAAIVNLTDAPVTVEKESGEGFMPVEIPAGRKFFMQGKVRFRYNGRTVFIEQHEEYAIWPGGAFGPQRRMQSLTGL